MSILTKDYVNFLSLQSSKKLTNPNSGTGFGTEHVFFSHCVCYVAPACNGLAYTTKIF